MALKLLYFTLQIETIGGLSRIVCDKVNALAARDYEVVICNVSAVRVRAAYPLDERVRLISCPVDPQSGNFWSRLMQTFRSVHVVREVIAQEKPDVIVNVHTPLVTWILPFIFRSIPKVVEIHFSHQGMELYARRMFGARTARMRLQLNRFIFSRYHRFVTLTHEDERVWALSNGAVIPNFTGIPMKIDNPLIEKRVIALARLVSQKRIDLLIKAWEKVASEFTDWELNVVGDSPYYMKYREMVIKRGLESSLHLCGGVKDVLPLLDASSLLCLTSEVEGFGIVLIEAMRRGIPVMAFEYEGVHDIVDDGVNGYIIPFGDVDAYAERMKLLLHDREERLRLRENAFDSVQKFDKDTIMQQWDNLFTALKEEN